MSSSTPITIITPNFNHGHVIHDNFRSVALQNIPGLEQIVVDDGSTDGSVSEIQEYARQYPFVRLLTSQKNCGPAHAANLAVDEAQGDYLLFLSADDVLLPGALQALLDVVVQDPHAALVCGAVEYHDVRRARTQVRSYLDVANPVFLSPNDVVSQQRRGLYVINGAAAIIRRDAFAEAGMLDVALKWHCDWVTLSAVAYRRGVWYVPKVVHRFSAGQSNFSAGARFWNEQKSVLARVFELLRSTEYEDVSGKFRESGSLGMFPFALRYTLTHADAHRFLNAPLLANAIRYSTFRSIRRIVPSALIDLYVRMRTDKRVISRRSPN